MENIFCWHCLEYFKKSEAKRLKTKIGVIYYCPICKGDNLIEKGTTLRNK